MEVLINSDEFNMILSGKRKEKYLEINSENTNLLEGAFPFSSFDGYPLDGHKAEVRFINSNDWSSFLAECTLSVGTMESGAGKNYYILMIHEIISK